MLIKTTNTFSSTDLGNVNPGQVLDVKDQLGEHLLELNVAEKMEDIKIENKMVDKKVATKGKKAK